MAAFVGTYSDGRTAARHDVNVTLGPLGLMISGPTVPPTSWPMADLRVLPSDRRDEPLRLTRRTNDELRLVVPDPQFRALLFRQVPALDPRHGRVGRTATIIGGSLAGAAALAALFWFGLPLISKPLAAAIPAEVEARIGAAIGDVLIGSEEVCENSEGEEALETLVDRVLGGVDGPVDVSVEVVDSPMVNAIALPGGRIVIFAGLLNKVESPDEVSGVLAHEIGHVVHRHSMQALVRHFALSMVITAFTGNDWKMGGAAQFLIQNAYSREAEAEADDTGVAILERAGLRADGLAAFFAKLQKDHDDSGLRYIGTHPPLADRQAKIARGHDGGTVLSDEDWKALKGICKND
jgi:Zn-dependent protease with chaperone function